MYTQQVAIIKKCVLGWVAWVYEYVRQLYQRIINLLLTVYPSEIFYLQKWSKNSWINKLTHVFRGSATLSFVNKQNWEFEFRSSAENQSFIHSKFRSHYDCFRMKYARKLIYRIHKTFNPDVNLALETRLCIVRRLFAVNFWYKLLIEVIAL